MQENNLCNDLHSIIQRYHAEKGWSALLRTHPDIRAIEAVLESTSELTPKQMRALTVALSARVTRTQGTQQFYTKSPNNPVNKAYIALAKRIAGQLKKNERPGLAAYQVLIPKLAAEDFLNIDIDPLSKKSEPENLFNCDSALHMEDSSTPEKKEQHFRSKGWKPGTFLIADRLDGIRAWRIDDLTTAYAHCGRFLGPAAKNNPNPIRPHEYRQLKTLPLPDLVASIHRAERKKNLQAEDVDQLPADAVDQLTRLATVFHNGPFHVSLWSSLAQFLTHESEQRSKEQQIDRHGLIKFYQYLEDLPDAEHDALLLMPVKLFASPPNITPNKITPGLKKRLGIRTSLKDIITSGAGGVPEDNLRGLLYGLTTDRFMCNETVAEKLSRLAQDIQYRQSFTARAKAACFSAQRAFRKAVLSAFYREESAVVFEDTYQHTLQYGICWGDLAWYKLANPFQWVAFILIGSAYLIVGIVISAVFALARLPFSLFSDLLFNCTGGRISRNSIIGGWIDTIKDISVWAILWSIKITLFLWRMISRPLDQRSALTPATPNPVIPRPDRGTQ